MPLPNVFDETTTLELKARIGRLQGDTPAQWGRMNVAQMLAHCCIPYEQLEGKVDGGSWLMRTLARLFFKNAVVGEEPFKQNIPTPKAFVVADERDFEREKARLIVFIETVHGRGAEAFEGRRHVSFGVLTVREWSNLIFKHLDHHLRQFGV